MKTRSLILGMLASTLFLFSGCHKDPPAPVACFSFSPQTDIAPGDEVVFTSCSTDAISYNWDFGDTKSSVAANPKHSYDTPGEYTVTLVVQNKAGQDQIEDKVTVISTVTACFTMSSSSVHVGENVTFTNCSQGADSYQWDLDGNGTFDTSTESPVMNYDTPGKINVKLVASKNGYSDEVVHELTILDNPVTACFTMSPNPAQVGENVNFTNCSVNATSYKWDFDGNGTFDSTDKDPVFYFNSAGKFNVKLVAMNGDASDEVVHEITITEEPVVIDPTDYWGMADYTAIYENDFTDNSNTDWSIGSDTDWEAYISDGEYIVTNSSTESNHYFWTNAESVPADNFDIEMEFQVTYDNANYGGGLLWKLLYNETTKLIDGYYIFRFSGGYYNYGDSQNGLWLSDWVNYGHGSESNLLTVRKYQGKYYMFINEEFLGQYDSSGEFGDKFGFFVGKETSISVTWVGLWSLGTTTKSAIVDANAKTKKSKPRVNVGVGNGKGFNQKAMPIRVLEKK